MAKPTEQSGESFMLKLARFIVDKRNLVFLVVIIGLIFSVFSRSWVQVENDLTEFSVQSITRGIDALGEVTIRVTAPDGEVYTGRGSDGDIVVSSTKAYLNALNRLLNDKLGHRR